MQQCTIELNKNIKLDFDENGKILGIEVLDASKVLNEKVLLNQADSPK